MDLFKTSKNSVINRITIKLLLVVMSLGWLGTASADMFGTTPTLTITGTVGNPITSTNLPIVIPLIVGTGQEVTAQNVNLVFMSSGFPQTFAGVVNVDIRDDDITATFSGTAQGVELLFSFDNLNGGAGTTTITSATTTASSGIVSGVNALTAPTFSGNTAVFGFNFFGFQPGTNVSHTIDLAFAGAIPNTAPSITSAATASVNENQTSAIDVQSTDDDNSEGSGLTYSKTGGADQALFNLNASTGVLTFVTAPIFSAPADAGGNNVYDIQVTVTDFGGLSASQDIAITVLDLNTAPSITSAATASVAENQTSAIDVQATDDNDSEGAGLTYTKTGGADQALFNLDINTGVLTFITAPDFEVPGDAGGNNGYDVQVTVTDSALLTDIQDILITVTDGNDAPIITSVATASAPENQTSVIDVQAIDDNDSEGAGLVFSITGGADQALFNIDNNTGVLTFITAPSFAPPADADGDNDFDVQVTVTDLGGLTTIQNILFSLTPVAVIPIFSPFGLLFVILGLFFIGRRYALLN